MGKEQPPQEAEALRALLSAEDAVIDELEDDEILDKIERLGRMMRAMAKVQGVLMREAGQRGIDKETILNAQRTNPTISEHRREKNRSRH